MQVSNKVKRGGGPLGWRDKAAKHLHTTQALNCYLHNVIDTKYVINMQHNNQSRKRNSYIHIIHILQ